MAFKYCFSFAIVLVANFDCNCFRIMPEIDFTLLHAAIWSSCAVLLESQQIPFSHTSHGLRPAALHRIRFATFCFVPMPYFSLDTNEYSNNWDETLKWALPGLVNNNGYKFSPIALKTSFHTKNKIYGQWLVTARICYKPLKYFWLSR